MKVSLNWIKEFTEIDLTIDQLVEVIGSQLGAVEEVVDLSKQYEGATVVRVVDCQPHPNADKLNVCLIDDGGTVANVERNSDGLVQVVCGAPNVRKDLKTVWLPPGTTVPSSYGKDPFVLQARELRGIKSNGMLASPHELAISDNHDGIIEIDEAIEPGRSFSEVFELNDVVIDIENKMFTHRPDLFGELGIAREIAGITNKRFVSPDWYRQAELNTDNTSNDLPLSVRIELPELVPRFMAVAIKGVKVKSSPISLQTLLIRVGIKPINNVVDITNLMMYLTAQPLHAYDYDKVAQLKDDHQAELVVRHPKKGESLKLLNGKQLSPRDETIMIASGDQLIGIGGVMGGESTEVDDATQNIILECATFDMYSIRRTSMLQGLFTEAVTRFTKGQSPLQNDKVLARTIYEITKVAGGQVASNIIDSNKLEQTDTIHQPVTLSVDFINARLGSEFSADTIKQLLENVEFTVEQSANDLRVTAPFWRTDIEIAEDVVEEVGRLHGMDKLPAKLPIRTIKPVTKDPRLILKTNIRSILANAGANEVLTYSFVHGNLLDKVGQDKEQAYSLSNALSPDLQHYRLSLTASLLERVHPNIKAGYGEFAIFEIGNVHSLNYETDDDGLPTELELLELVYAASKKPGSAFYTAQKYLNHLADNLNIEIELRSLEASTDPVVVPYDVQRSALVFIKGTDYKLGIVGEYKQNVVKNLKLPSYCAGFSLSLDVLSQHLKTIRPYKPLSRFPKVTQDITLKVSSDVSYQAVVSCIADYLEANQQPHISIEVIPLDIYQSQEDNQYQQITFRLIVTNTSKTMTDAEVGTILDNLAETTQKQLGAERI